MAVLTNIPNNTSARDWRDTVNALIKRIAALEAAGVPVEIPAPAFTTQPNISPTSGTAGSTVYAATPGTVSNGAVVSRAWLLNGTAISTGVTALPASSGTLAYQETASGPGGTTTSTVQVAAVTAATVTPTPAPSFISQPSISPNTGTAGATTFTATAGNVSNGSITARSWTINGTVISTGITASPASSGTLTYQETATGPGGTAQSTVQQVTVATAAAPAPAFTAQPTVSPSSGTAGTTTYTATPGAVSNGTITSRAWALNGSVISTGLTAAPASAGTLTYQEFATGTGGSASSSVLTRTVSAATPTLTLSPASISIASNAAAGTTVSNITNVPSGVTPSVTPNDGRLVIAGSASAGWKVVVGMSALSAGQLNFSVAASGATGASGVLTVTPAAQTIETTFVSSVNQVANTVSAIAGTDGKVDRWPIYFPKAVTEIELAWNYWYMGSGNTGVLSDPSANGTFRAAYAECNGQVVQLTFGGSPTRAVTAGENNVRPQVLKPEMFGFSGAFPAGTTLWTDTDFVHATTGQTVPSTPRNVSDTSGSQSVHYSTATVTPVNLGGIGPVTFTGGTGTARTVGWQPFAIGKLANLSDVWLARGDSITAGTGDNFAKRDGRGWFQIACSAMGVPCCNLAVHGSGSSAGASDARLSYWYEFANNGVVFYGTNDIGQDGTGSPTALATRVTAIRDTMKANGKITRVGVCKLLVRTFSSDNWATEEDQTMTEGSSSFANWWSPTGNPALYNQQVPSLGFDFVIPFDSVRGVTNPYKWRTTGAAQGYAFDTTHVSVGGAQVMAAEARPLMSNGAVIITPPAASPVIGTPGSITTDGTPKVGETVTIVAASDVTGATSVVYRLRRNGVNAATTVAPGPYTLVAGDQVASLILRTEATNSAGETATANSAEAGPVAAASAGGGAVGTVLFSDSFANSSTTTDQSFTDHVSESGHHWAKAGSPDVATVWGLSGNQAVSANATGLNNEAVRTSGVVTPTRISDLVLPSQNYDVIVPMIMRTRINNVFYGIYVRGEDTSKRRYNVGLSTSISGGGTWMVRRVAGAAGETATFTTVGQSTPGDGKVAGDRWTMKVSVRTVGSDVNIKIYVDSGSGYVLMTDATDVAANSPLLTGDIGIYSVGGLSTTTGTGFKADVVPMQVISA
jgi:hypothetical protein